MNREKIIRLVKESTDEILIDELDYYMGIERDYPYDLADALDDAYDFAEGNADRKMVKSIRLILISAGYFIKQFEKTDFGRDTRVQVNGVKYHPIKHWSGWINE